jgi:hypothetical protein
MEYSTCPMLTETSKAKSLRRLLNYLLSLALIKRDLAVVLQQIFGQLLLRLARSGDSDCKRCDAQNGPSSWSQSLLPLECDQHR